MKVRSVHGDFSLTVDLIPPDPETYPGALPGFNYRHYKGGYYIVVGIAIKDDRPVVIYQAYEGPLWMREYNPIEDRVAAGIQGWMTPAMDQTGAPVPRFAPLESK